MQGYVYVCVRETKRRERNHRQFWSYNLCQVHLPSKLIFLICMWVAFISNFFELSHVAKAGLKPQE